MVTLTQDPTNPERLIVTETVTFYLDKILIQTLSDELEKAIRSRAISDLSSNAAVRKLVAKAATEKLLQMLGYVPEEKKPDAN